MMSSPARAFARNIITVFGFTAYELLLILLWHVLGVMSEPLLQWYLETLLLTAVLNPFWVA